MTEKDIKEQQIVSLACELVKLIYSNPEQYGDVIAWQSFNDLLIACKTGNGIIDTAKRFIDDINAGYLWAGDLPQDERVFELMKLIEEEEMVDKKEIAEIKK